MFWVLYTRASNSYTHAGSNTIYLQHLLKMHNKGLFLDALSALCKLYLVISIRDMRSLPHSSVGFGMKYPYHEQNQTFWVSKIAADLSDFATKELNPRFWLTGNKRDTTILIRLALNNKVSEKEGENWAHRACFLLLICYWSEMLQCIINSQGKRKNSPGLRCF